MSTFPFKVKRSAAILSTALLRVLSPPAAHGLFTPGVLPAIHSFEDPTTVAAPAKVQPLEAKVAKDVAST
jgi:hypothetical protein